MASNKNLINQFTFFRNYHDFIKELNYEKKCQFLIAIDEYVFEDNEPYFDGLDKAIWNMIKVSLDVSKNKSANARKPSNSNKKTKNQNEIKSKSNENQIKIKSKSNEKQCSISFSSSISNNNYLKDRGLLRGKIEEWLEYKLQRKEKYTERGFKSLLTQIQNNCELYGDDNIVSLIDECMASNYKGIIFEKLEKKPKKVGHIPDWFDKEHEAKEITPEEQKEMDEILNNLC